MLGTLSEVTWPHGISINEKPQLAKKTVQKKTKASKEKSAVTELGKAFGSYWDWMEGRADKVESRLDVVELRLRKLEKSCAEIKCDIAEIKHDISILVKRMKEKK